MVLATLAAAVPATALGAGGPLPRNAGLENLRPFFDHVEVARGAVLLNSDSRMLYQGHGIQHGLERAFLVHPEFDLYGTCAYSAGSQLRPW